MAVKTLKTNLRKFSTLINQKFIFVNCKSVSVMTRTPLFLLQPKLFCLAVSSSNYWLYGFNASRFQKNFIFFGYFRIIGSF